MSNNFMIIIFFLTCALLILPLSVRAETYSWVDENGTISFTDDPS